MSELDHVYRVIGFAGFWAAVAVSGLAAFACARDAWRRHRRAQTIQRTTNESIAADNARDGFSWPCFGGPLDGERRSACPNYWADGKYEFWVDHQRFEWHQRAPRQAP